VGWFFGALAWAVAASVGLVVALVLAATMVAIAVVAAAPLMLSMAALRTHRLFRAAADPGLLEARHVGGHSWVAYAGNTRH
jgi:hypothetical protein